MQYYLAHAGFLAEVKSMRTGLALFLWITIKPLPTGKPHKRLACMKRSFLEADFASIQLVRTGVKGKSSPYPF